MTKMAKCNVLSVADLLQPEVDEPIHETDDRDHTEMNLIEEYRRTTTAGCLRQMLRRTSTGENEVEDLPSPSPRLLIELI